MVRLNRRTSNTLRAFLNGSLLLIRYLDSQFGQLGAKRFYASVYTVVEALALPSRNHL